MVSFEGCDPCKKKLDLGFPPVELKECFNLLCWLRAVTLFCLFFLLAEAGREMDSGESGIFVEPDPPVPFESCNGERNDRYSFLLSCSSELTPPGSTSASGSCWVGEQTQGLSPQHLPV